jgi:cysteine desulfurase/selenocysteine lyase
MVSHINDSIHQYRNDFKTLNQVVHGLPLVYFDNAATTLKPIQVVEEINRYNRDETATVHRGVHHLSQMATIKYEEARELVQNFIHAHDRSEIIFTKGTTDSLNLLASSFGDAYINAGDEILISAMEHHSNIVPWQFLCERKKAILKVIPMNEKGELLIDQYAQLLTAKTKLVVVVHVSNSLGTINPIKQMISMAHKMKAKVVVDAAQSIAHFKTDVQDLDCDFLVFSGHKMFGPTGIGVLYGKKAWLEQMPPYQGGGAMIESVTFAKTTYAPLPDKFEAGTPNIAGVLGLGEAIRYINHIGLAAIQKREDELLKYATSQLLTVPGLRIIGTAEKKASIISFVLENIHPHDIGTFTDQDGIAVRTGHHCTQPVMEFFKVPATTRASFCFYNNEKEIDLLVQSLKKTVEFFK